jgi:8-oxo-dGTP pyrophosphatase MutT (NUDIX family)
MLDDAIVAAISARLARALRSPTGAYRPLWIERDIVGWLDDARVALLVPFDDVFAFRADGITFRPTLSTPVDRTDALARVARALAAAGHLTAWRDERYAVAADFGTPAHCLLERAAARFFGIRTYAAHVNGLVTADGATAMWIARRSAAKSIDPGLLDNLVGGGIAAGARIDDTLVREAREEAGIPAALARTAKPAGAVHVCRTQPDGLQRETIFVHDLVLPPDFTPAGEDGEVADCRLVPLDEAARLVANDEGPDAVTADASLVIVDCLLRHGTIAPDAAGYLALEALRHPRMAPERRR